MCVCVINVCVQFTRCSLFYFADSYQGEVGAYLVLGGVDITGAHLFTIHAHGSTDKLPYVTMGTPYLIPYLFSTAMAKSIEME